MADVILDVGGPCNLIRVGGGGVGARARAGISLQRPSGGAAAASVPVAPVRRTGDAICDGAPVPLDTTAFLPRLRRPPIEPRPTHPADSRCPQYAAGSDEQGASTGQSITTLDPRALWPQGLLQAIDRHRQQACPDTLGHARQVRTLRCVGVATASHAPATARRQRVSPINHRRKAAPRDSKTRSDRTRDEPGYSVGEHSTWHRRSPVSRYAEVQIGFSRAAHIVARARIPRATRPFCKDAVSSFVYRRARSHNLTTVMPPSTGPPPIRS